MNAVYGPSLGRRAASTFGSITAAAVWAVAQGVRVLLFAVLATFEPIVRCVLSFAALGGFLTAGLFYFAGPPGLHVSYGVLLVFSTGCAVTLAAYELLVRALEP